MKTTFRDEINRFDESFVENEKMLIEPVAFNIDRVTANVMRSIRTKPKQNKRWVPLLVAAAIMTAVIGTTVLATTVFTPFSGKYRGDTDTLKIYTNDSFHFTSPDSNLHAEYAGFVGDEDFSLAAVQLTKNNGDTFIKEENVLSGQSKLAMSGYSYSINSTPFDEEAAPGNEFPEYYLSKDKKTLTLYLTAKTPSEEADNLSLSFDSDTLYAYTVKDKLSESNVITSPLKTDDLEEDSILHRYENYKHVEYSIDTTPYELDYHIDIELKEKPEAFLKTELTSKEAPDLLKDGEKVEMTLSPFKLKLSCSNTWSDDVIESYKAESLNDYYMYINKLSPFSRNYYELINPINSGIVMKDGRQFYFVQNKYPVEIVQDPNDKNKWISNSELILSFLEYPADPYSSLFLEDTLPKAVIDPEQIGIVVINGNVVYTAPGCESMVLQELRLLSNMWTVDEIEALINSFSIDIYDLRKTTNLFYPETEITGNSVYLYGSGSKDEILSFVFRAELEKPNGLYINGINLEQKPSGDYVINIELISPYIFDDAAYPNAKAYVEKLTETNWSTIIYDFLDYGLLPDEAVDINLDLSPYEPGRENPPPTVSEPERTVAVRSDMSKLRFKVWSDEEIKNLISKEISHPLYDNCYSIKNNNKNNHNESDFISCKEIKISAYFTKNELYNFVNSMAAQEENNLFITNIEMTPVDNADGLFRAEVTVQNPCEKNVSLSKIRNKYGKLSRSELIASAFNTTEGYEFNNIEFHFWRIASDNEKANAIIRLTIILRNASMEDYKQLFNKLNSSSEFHIANELSFSEEEFEGHFINETDISLTLYLLTYAFSN